MNNQGGAFEEVLAFLSLTPLDFQMILVGIVFFVLYWKLSEKTLFQPYLDLYEARESATSGAETTASEKIAEAERVEANYEEQLTEARVQAMQKKLSKLSDANKKATEILSQAENDARDTIVQGRKEIEQSLAQLREEAFAEADAIADEIVRRLKEPPQPAPQSLSH